jgi:hypothetical protein
MPDKNSQKYSDLSTVEKQRDYLTAEEMPEGPYGSPIGKDNPVQNKSTPWQEGQRYYTPFNWENKSLHQDLPRQMDGAHPPHDDPDTDEQEPYTNGKSGG